MTPSLRWRHNGGACRRCSARRFATAHNSAYAKCWSPASGGIPALRIRRRRYVKFIFSNTMNKNIFFFLGISFCAFLIVPTTYACDPLGCLLGGHKQDTLILGEVVSGVKNELDIKIIFVFPQNQVKSIEEGDQMKVRDIAKAIDLTESEFETITVGKKYLMSLNRNDNFYIPSWGIYEITGNSYSDAKLVKNKSIDDEALQIFINSGGTEKDFAFDYSGVEPVLIRNGIRQTSETKEKNILWNGAGIGVLVLVGGIVLITRMKKINII